jgi:uncharacterized protein YecA (UPF0149 family)
MNDRINETGRLKELLEKYLPPAKAGPVRPTRTSFSEKMAQVNMRTISKKCTRWSASIASTLKLTDEVSPAKTLLEALN